MRLRSACVSIPVFCYSFFIFCYSIMMLLMVPAPAVSKADGGTNSVSDSLSLQIMELRNEGFYTEALDVARNLFEILSQNPETKPWEVGDAERLIEMLEYVVGLPEKAQQELAEADRLTADIEQHIDKGEYSIGVEVAERQLEIRMSHLGEEDTDVAESLSNLGGLLWETGDYAGARPLYERALEIRKKILGPEHPDVASSLNNLGLLLWKTGDYAGVRPLYERALEIREKALGPEHEDVATSLNNLGVLLWKIGDYAGARPLYERALEIRKKVLGPEHPDVALILNDLAILSKYTGEFERARSLYTRALEINEKAFGPEHPWVATNLNNLGIVLRKTGDYVGARCLYDRALEIRVKTLGPEHLDVAMTLNNLALLLKKTGDYVSARSLYERALKIQEKALGPEHPDVALSLNNLASLLMQTNFDAEARLLHERALKIREKVLNPEHPYVAMSLNNLGLLLTKMGNYTEARSSYERSLKIREKAHGLEHPDVAESLNNLGVLFWKTGDFVGARSLYEKSLAIREKTLGPEHPLIALSLQKLGLLLWNTGDIDMAESLLIRASTIFEVARLRAGTGFVRATFLDSPYPDLAVVKLALGKTEEAWPAAEKCLGRALADLLIASGQRCISPSEIAREDSLKAALSHLENQMAVLQKTVQADTTVDAAKKFKETRLRLLNTEATWSAFQRELAAKYPVTEGQAFALDRIQAHLSKETALIGWLCEELYPGEFVSWGYTIRNSGPVNWVRLNASSPSADVRSSVKRACDFQKALLMAASWQERVTEVDDLNSYATKVWEEWVAPLTRNLSGVENLVVLPSKPMLGIPIEALVDSTGSYLGERYAVSYAPSATVYAWLLEQEEARAGTVARKAFLLGDPPFTEDHARAMNLEKEREASTVKTSLAEQELHIETNILRSTLAGDETALANLPRLHWTRDEVNRVVHTIPEATILLGSQASEQEIIRLVESAELREFDTIHLATHALVDDEQPERSALVLSQVNLPDPLEAVKAGTRIYDGLLTVKEIVCEWDLNADLVTLSACQSGLGREVAGEGYIGLAYAFLQAGSRSLLVSLWKVEDEATCLLMGRFYENLTGNYRDKGRKGSGKPKTKAEALQEAKYWLRTYTDERGQQIFRHPVYWSAFILIGDAR